MVAFSEWTSYYVFKPLCLSSFSPHLSTFIPRSFSAFLSCTLLFPFFFFSFLFSLSLFLYPSITLSLSLPLSLSCLSLTLSFSFFLPLYKPYCIASRLLSLVSKMTHVHAALAKTIYLPTLLRLATVWSRKFASISDSNPTYFLSIIISFSSIFLSPPSTF